MDTHELRASFRQFAGDDRYSKFVRAVDRACRGKGRLFYWQEQLWGEFVATTPDAPQSAEQILISFHVCDVHDSPLESLPSNESLPAIRDTPEYDLTSDRLFPFAISEQPVCPQCEAARERWIKENADLCRTLRCKTTYEDYCHRRLEDLTDPPEMKEKIKQRSTEIAAQMEPGDELWEWDAGGWHRLRGRAGVAIVRNEKIVKEWCEWSS